MREIFFLVDAAGQVLWQDTADSPLALPDSRARWEAIWRHREGLFELSHSHPLGPDTFSDEDRTTMDALELALGRRLRFSLVTPGGYFVRGDDGAVTRAPAPAWATTLLSLSVR